MNNRESFTNCICFLFFFTLYQLCPKVVGQIVMPPRWIQWFASHLHRLRCMWCTTWVFLDVIILGVINFLEKKMRDRVVPLGMLEIYPPKFREVLQCKQNNRKNNGYNLYVNILYKKIFFLWFFHLNHNLKVDDESVFLILKVNRGLRVVYSKMTLSKGEEHVCSSTRISQTWKDILWSFLFFVKPLFLCRVALTINLKSPSLKEVPNIYRWN